MNEQQIINALTYHEGPERVFQAVLAVLASEVTNAIDQVSDVATMGEARAFYAGQVAALADLKALLEDLREQAKILALDPNP